MYLVQKHSLGKVKKFAKRISNFHRTRKCWSWDVKTVPLTAEQILITTICTAWSPFLPASPTHVFFSLAVAVFCFLFLFVGLFFLEAAVFQHSWSQTCTTSETLTPVSWCLSSEVRVSGSWGAPAKNRNARTS